MICIAPSHQFPLGRTLSLERRLAVLEWARQSAAWVIEDDFDSEFRYAGAPIASLQGLDTANRVIYVGTFSKTVYPALRLGYLISPPELLGRFGAAKAIIDCLSPTVEQATLTDFIQQGHFTRHVRRMRAIYRERQDALLEAAKRELSGILRVQAAETGMHVMGWLMRRGAEDLAVSQEARKHGIEAQPLTRYCMSAALPPALVLGFGALPPRELVIGIRKLRDVLSRAK
jgi:GntR family transcriptional regulator/MocR family aminotransferase